MDQPPEYVESKWQQHHQVITQTRIPAGVLFQQSGPQGPIIIIADSQQGGLVGVESEMNPPLGCVLAETIIGMFCNCICGWCTWCCCFCIWYTAGGLIWGFIPFITSMIGFVVGLIGIILESDAQSKKHHSHHQAAHGLGITSLSCIAVGTVIGVIFLLLTIIFIHY